MTKFTKLVFALAAIGLLSTGCDKVENLKDNNCKLLGNCPDEKKGSSEPSGSLDTTFNGKGYLLLEDSSSIVADSDRNESKFTGFAVDSSGKYIVAGSLTNSGSHDFKTRNIILKYNTDGTLDTTFDDDGILTFTVHTNSDANETIEKMVIDSDDNLYILGTTDGEANAQFYIAKIKADGTFDPDFTRDINVSSKDITIQAGVTDYSGNFVVDASGNVYVSGLYDNGLIEDKSVIFKYTSAGVLDTSFDNDGIWMDWNMTKGAYTHSNTNSGNKYPIKSLVIDSNGNIYGAGQGKPQVTGEKSTRDDAFVIKLDSTGSYDTSFNGTGILSIQDALGEDNQTENVSGMVTDSSGNMYVLSYGNVNYSPSRSYTGAYAGSSATTLGQDYNSSITKVKSDGTIDTSFGTNGHVILDDLNSSSVTIGDLATVMTIDGSHIYVAGRTGKSNTDSNGDLGNGIDTSIFGTWNLFVTRYSTSGSVDTSFGNNGVVVIENNTTTASTNIVPSKIEVKSGKVFVVGKTGSTTGNNNVGAIYVIN